ncbi:type II secretion system major pseudopilin GspG [Yersinia ruckeri]|uniref:type II secretion system major pseudopilin GspG n=1 Tax=Yersinia ruckeri TaxID=29486 RepID=UPI0022645178|nr:type II secretion system major pseudopilin GspG [Yersinia ruckeri]UZX71236.1 type II secretion system major pseudopilin GspG [Yersinia ruckeri]
MSVVSVKFNGFTLLEVMIVIVILGLLASLTIPNLMANKDKADIQKVISDISTLENALDMYKLDNGIYPSDEQGIISLVTRPIESPLPVNYRSNGYLRRLPKDPWGNEYLIKNPGVHNVIDVFSKEPDGEINTSDDIGNWISEELIKSER